MATITWTATVDDLYRAEGKAELVDGGIVRMRLGGCNYGIAKGNVLVSLHDYAKRVGEGIAFGSTVVFLCDLPNRRSFSPDCSYFIGPRAGKDFLPQVPIFAVEVRG